MNQIVYKLIVQKGPAPGEEFILDRPEIVIGRDIKNEVVINDAEMSRHHAKLLFKDEKFVVQDMGSTNGVFVNEQRVSGLMPLEDGAQIRMGDHVILKYVIEIPDFERTLVSQAKPSAPPPPAPVAQPVQASVPQPAPTSAPQQPQPSPASAAPVKQAPAPASQKPAAAVPQGYAGQLPDNPPTQQLKLPFEVPFDMRMLSLGCGGIAIVVAIILILVLMYIDSNMLWCDWLGWLIPNRCPIG